MIEVFFDFGPHKANDYVSELAATDQRLSELLRGADFATAAVIGLGVILSVVGGRVRGWVAALGWMALAVFAIATALDSVWPLSCAPHADPDCAAREAIGAVPIAHQLHTVSSVIAVAAAFISLMAFLRLDAAQQTSIRVHRLGLWVLGALAVTTVWTIIGVILDSIGGVAALGVAQRLQLLSVASWLVYVALRLHPYE